MDTSFGRDIFAVTITARPEHRLIAIQSIILALTKQIAMLTTIRTKQESRLRDGYRPRSGLHSRSMSRLAQ